MTTVKLIDQAAQLIANASCPVSFSGAGLSAESGIATFRDSKDPDAHWAKFDPMQLASQGGFASAPDVVIDWYNDRRKTLATAHPNDAHRCLARQPDWTHITQNVDDLLERAGAAGEQVLHLHGTLLEDHCNANCGCREKVDLNSPPVLRKCQCGHYMRPSVVWFGEALPEELWQSVVQKTENTDLMLVVGTSAKVYPAAGLIELAKRNGADVIVVNAESLGDESVCTIELIGAAAELLPQLFN